MFDPIEGTGAPPPPIRPDTPPPKPTGIEPGPAPATPKLDKPNKFGLLLLFIEDDEDDAFTAPTDDPGAPIMENPALAEDEEFTDERRFENTFVCNGADDVLSLLFIIIRFHSIYLK